MTSSKILTTELMLPPLSLYVHIPWCVKKCPYCDFNSHAQGKDLPQSDYIDALIADLEQDTSYIQGRQLHSIFIGGGTPSLIHAEFIHQLITRINSILDFSPNIEITMEANPGTLEHDDFAAYQAAGINRLSIGIQSFDSDKLQTLGRIHNGKEAKLAASKALNSNFSSVNLDLMHGLPKQSLEDALTDLDTAIALSPTHLSWYQLTLEPNTLFYSQPPKLPDDELLWQIYYQGHKKLIAQGYQQYEISAYAKTGFECQHNLNYWQYGDYIGIGCGAHGKITIPSENKIIRTVKLKHPKGYLAASNYLYDKQEIHEDDRSLEYLMNRLRLMSPIDKYEFENFTGIKHQSLEHGMRLGQDKGLIENTTHHWTLTEKGHLFINDLLSQFC